MKFAYYIFLPS